MTHTRHVLKWVMSLLLEAPPMSWRSTKQTLVATSSNHAKILALHKSTHECFWLRAVVEHIQSTCSLSFVVNGLQQPMKITLLVTTRLRKKTTSNILSQIFFLLTSASRAFWSQANMTSGQPAKLHKVTVEVYLPEIVWFQ